MQNGQREQFQKDGYLLVRNVLSPEQVAQLRTFFQPRFTVPPEQHYPADNDHSLQNIFVRYPQVRWLLFHEPTLRVLRTLVADDLMFVREAVAVRNGFGGWHKDTTSQEGLYKNNKYYLASDYLMVEVAYYLQDNSEEYGGGLNVEPGSHLVLKDPFVPKTKIEKALERYVYPYVRRGDAWRDRLVKNPVMLPIKAGDLLIFHFRLIHRATPKKVETLPPEREKIALFHTCSTNTPHVKTYHEYLQRMHTYMQNFAYPPELLQQACDAGVTLA